MKVFRLGDGVRAPFAEPFGHALDHTEHLSSVQPHGLRLFDDLLPVDEDMLDRFAVLGKVQLIDGVKPGLEGAVRS